MFIQAKNGNVVETSDPDHALRALADGHDVFESDPRVKGKRLKKWSPDGATDADDADSGTE